MLARFFMIAPTKDDLSDYLGEYTSSGSGTNFDLVGLISYFSEHGIVVIPKGSEGTSIEWKYFDGYGKAHQIHDEHNNEATGFVLQFEGALDSVLAQLSKIFRRDNEKQKLVDAPFVGTEFVPGASSQAKVWQHWCAPPNRNTFGTVERTKSLIGSEILKSQNLTGSNVNVLLVDQGVSRTYLGGNYGGGIIWIGPNGMPRAPGGSNQPYVKMQREHGNAMARNILALAPDATIFDAPFIPGRINDVLTEAQRLSLGFLMLPIFFWFMRHIIGRTGPWIVVNPWGIFDRLRESIPGHYTENPNHPLNDRVANIAHDHDVLFSAGNNGQFCPDPRAGVYDRGPGRSIWGANGLEDVYTVGSVRADALWIGTSSQGPASTQMSTQLINQKPDFSAPSWFSEANDAGLANTGTSTSVAVTAGALAALRQKWPTDPGGPGTVVVSPTDMKQAIKVSSKKRMQHNWNNRTGEGVLSIPNVIAHLP